MCQRLRIPANGMRKLSLKRNKTQFKTYGTVSKLTIVGRTKCLMQAKCRESVHIMIYVVRGAQESLLGLAAGEALGKIFIRPEARKKEESVREIHETIKRTVKEGQVVSGGQTK